MFKSHSRFQNLKEDTMGAILPSVILTQLLSVIRQLPGHKPIQVFFGKMFLKMKQKTYSIRQEQSKNHCSTLEWVYCNRTQGKLNINKQNGNSYAISKINAYGMTSSQRGETWEGKHVVLR